LFSDAPTQAFPGYRIREQDQVHRTERKSNSALCDFIQSCEIDVLVDLNAYSAPERLALFLSHPAPLVLGWFNHYGTSGFPGIDAIVGDARVVTPDEESCYTESVWRLPLSYLTFQPPTHMPRVTPPPCLRNGVFTFGSLATLYKITDPVVALWSEILRRTSRTRLVLGCSAFRSEANRAYTRTRFEAAGVSADRLVLLAPKPNREFVRYYSMIDVALDPFPYSGGTTTMEALWQGVPVLTCPGDRWASRTSVSLMYGTPFRNYIARNRDDYLSMAVDLAKDTRSPSRLGRLRHEARKRLRASRVLDGRRLAREMERLFRRVR